MPSMRDVNMSAEVGRGRGLGFLLRQCFSGGVFRWLMLACGEDIDKIIQVRISSFKYVDYTPTVYFVNVETYLCVFRHMHAHELTRTQMHTHIFTQHPNKSLNGLMRCNRMWHAEHTWCWQAG